MLPLAKLHAQQYLYDLLALTWLGSQKPLSGNQGDLKGSMQHQLKPTQMAAFLRKGLKAACSPKKAKNQGIFALTLQ